MTKNDSKKNVAEDVQDYSVIDVEESLRMYEQMVKIRFFEQKVDELYRRAIMPGLAHLYIGEEAVAVGVCETLEKTDYITSTHRGHGHCLAKGASVERMFAELLGKKPGYCKGKGGSMHIADPDSGNLGANAIVGASSGIATGAAFANNRLKNGRIAVAFFGEGALGQGLIYEVMNMASLWNLPVIYVCENNLYNEYTPYKEATAGELLDRPKAFGIHTEEVDGQDVRQVYLTMQRLVERARNGEGPAFLLSNTYRYKGHHVGDVNRGYYRSKEEEEFWQSHHDPIIMLAKWLTEEREIPKTVLEEIEETAQKEIESGVAYAVEAPYPDTSEVDEDVYA
jgi:pyruvate dehydrogenase E1 component alpha subunit